LRQFSKKHQKKSHIFPQQLYFTKRKGSRSTATASFLRGHTLMKKLFGYWLFFFFFLYVRRMKPLSFKHGFCPFLQISQRMSFLVFARFWRRYVFSEFIGVSPFQPGAACVHRQHFLISRELPFRTF
jgi:hypothetical protein